MTASRRHWLVVFNCQAMGLAHCLTLLNHGIRVEYHDPLSFSQNRESILQRVGDYDRVLMLAGEMGDPLRSIDNVWRMPGMNFSGYHPDMCFLFSAGKDVFGPLGNCHSIIAYAAFQCGLDEREAVSLFREETYLRLGYFDHWSVARDELVGGYGRYGFDIGQKFVDWTRQAPFMHMYVHPKILCLHGLAKVILDRAGLEVEDTGLLPYDNLANGAGFPVYPEIASQLGVVGSYWFKPGATYELINLTQFVAASFQVYRGLPGANTILRAEAVLAEAIAFIEEGK